MEVVRSGTLGILVNTSEKLIRQRKESGNKFTDEEAAKIMGAIFRGVSYIHSVSIIHRDIKPGTNSLIQKTFYCPPKMDSATSKSLTSDSALN